MASAAHEVFKGVNLIDHVSLEDRLRGQRYWGFGCMGNMVFVMEVDKTDWDNSIK